MWVSVVLFFLQSVLEQYRATLLDIDNILNGYGTPVEETVQKLLTLLEDEALFEAYLAEAVQQVRRPR